MSDLKEFPERFDMSNEITTEMRKLSSLAAKAFDDTLDVVAQTGREGWDEIAGRRVPNYIPHVHSPSKVMRAIDDYGQDQVELVFANALRDMKGDLGDKLFTRMIKRIVAKISNAKYYGQESDLARAFQGSNTAVIREFLEGLDLTEQQINIILNKIQKGSGNTVAIKVEATDTNQASLDMQNSAGWFRFITNDGALRIYDQSNNAERWRISNSGNVGIGTSNPTAKLDVKGTGGSTSGFSFRNSHETVRGYFGSDNDNADFLFTYVGTESAEVKLKHNGNVILCESGGNVGINKPGPQTALDVAGTVTATAFAGPITGNVEGDVTGNVTGDVTGNVTGQVSSILNHTTTNLTEGENLYFTNSRADARVNEQTGANLDLSLKTTDELPEGSTNLYHTPSRAVSAVTASNLDMGGNKVLFANVYSTEGDLPNAGTYHGMFAHVHATGKGYFAHAGAWHKLLDESSSSTTNLSEGSNLYYTDARVDTKLSTGVSNIVTTGYLRGPAEFTIDPAAHGNNTGKVIIAGDLQVDGTTTTINSTTLDVEDLNITLASGSTDKATASGAGITVDIGTNDPVLANPKIEYVGTSSNDYWSFNKSAVVNGNLSVTGSFLDSNA